MLYIEEALDVKKANYRNIYQLFFQNDKLSKPQIVKLLNLSLPTVSNNISEPEMAGKIREVFFNRKEDDRRPPID